MVAGVGCRPRADCCLASLSRVRRISSFSRGPRMLCGTGRRQWRSVKAAPPSLPPSVHPWLVLFLALAALPCLSPSLPLSHPRSGRVCHASCGLPSPSCRSPASQGAGQLARDFASNISLGKNSRGRPTEATWLATISEKFETWQEGAVAPIAGPRRMLCTYQRVGVWWHGSTSMMD